MQNTNYSDTFHKVNKGNMIEAKYVLENQEARNMAGHQSCLSIFSI